MQGCITSAEPNAFQSITDIGDERKPVGGTDGKPTSRGLYIAHFVTRVVQLFDAREVFGRDPY